MGKVLDVITLKAGDCSELTAIKDSVEEYVEENLNQYIKKCEDYCKSNSLSFQETKGFFDAVWGTIELNQGEVFLIDSPIIQRLRKIKQLGLVDLLYSSATHSRFSHMLGVIHTSDLIASQIINTFSKSNRDYTFDENTTQIIRLASIFHDCGHFFGSHASEIFFQSESSQYTKVKNIETARLYFSKNLNIKPSITEIISVLILNSPKMRRLLSVLDKGFEKVDFNNSNESKIIEQIACLVLGYPYNIKWVPFSQIINGKIDADKLDYLRRDAYSTGLPSPVDYSRIIQKVRITNNNKILSMISNGGDQSRGHLQLAIAPSAVNTIDQLIISRYMMFENVYVHPKTLSTEIYFRRALSLLDSATTGLLDNFRNILEINDCDIINKNIDFAAERFSNIKIIDEDRYSEARTIFRNIYNRDLLKRCVAISPRNISYTRFASLTHYSDIFIDRIPEEQNNFITKIKQKLNLILNQLNISDESDVILMQYPDIPETHFDSDIPIAIADKKDIYRNYIFETDNWLMSRESRNKMSYLIGSSHLRYHIFLATEIVLFEEYGILLQDGDLYDENEEEKINELRKSLKPIYKNALPLIHIESIINSRDLFKEIVHNWGSYESINNFSDTRFRLESEHLENFIHQFYRFNEDLGDFNLFVDGVCKLLEDIHIVNNEEIEKSLLTNLQNIIHVGKIKPDEILLCSLGNFQDSSGIIANHVNVINNHFNERWVVKRPEEISVDDCNGTIVFIDDAFYTGIQLTSIFESIVGVPIEKRKVEESHVAPLHPNILQSLRKRKIYLSFIYGNPNKKENILQTLRDMEIPIKDIIAYQSFPEPYFEKEYPNNQEQQREIVRKYFHKAGTELIYYKSHDENGKYRKHWNEERANNSVLGYENAQQLLVFPWNTPTYTLTPLWLGCDKQEFNWNPIFTRIDKKHLTPKE